MDEPSRCPQCGQTVTGHLVLLDTGTIDASSPLWHTCIGPPQTIQTVGMRLDPCGHVLVVPVEVTNV